MIRRYELDDGTTTFWEIENLDDVSFVCRWGKVGALGRNQRNYAYADRVAADKAAGKLIAEHAKQGFALIGGKARAPAAPAVERAATKPAKATPAPSTQTTIEVVTTPPPATGIGNPKLEDILADNPEDAGSWQVYADWLIENGEPWGEVIAAAATGKRLKKDQDEAATKMLGELDGSSLSWRFGTIEEASLCPEEGHGDGDDSKYKGALKRILKHPAGRLIRSLELGLPPGADCDWSYEPILPVLRKAGRLPLLATLDMSIECEFMDQESWRGIGDLTKLWEIAPRLRELRLRGTGEAERTKLGDIVAPYLETVLHISSGLDKGVPKDLGRAHLPELSHLELYVGDDNYGNCTLKSFAGIFAGDGLPRLSYLGVVNSDWEADLVAALAAAPIVKRLRTLDLSKGTLWRAGTAALIEHAAAFRHLESLVLDDNYLTPEQQAAIGKVIPCATFGDQKEIEDEDDDEPYRYVTVGE